MVRKIVLAALVTAIGWSTLGAQDLAKFDSSLQKVPADVAFYSSSLRVGEQIDIFLKSNAYAKLRAMPAAKFVWQQMQTELAKPDNPVGQAWRVFQAPENEELRKLLHDFCKHEIFSYGGDDSIQFITVLANMGNSMRFDQLMSQMAKGRGQDPNKLQAKAMLGALNAARDKLVIPDIVFGFRLSNVAPAKSQIARLEAMLKPVFAQQPKLKGRLKSLVTGDAEGIVVDLDGSMIPWDKIPMDEIEDEKDEYKPLIDKLKELKLSVALAVRGDYMLLSFGKNTGAFAKFGASPPLATRAEMKPLAKYLDKRIVSINYSSEKLYATVATTAAQFDDMAKGTAEWLKLAPISDKLREKIAGDVKTMLSEMAATLPKPAATMGFAFLTSHGMEGYDFNYGAGVVAPKHLTILDHVGGSPLIFAAGRGADATPAYKYLVKWIKTFFGHAEAAFEEIMPAQVEQAKMGFQQFLPFLKRFDELTGDMLLPSLADGQGALVIDAKWKSAKWFPELDQKGKSLPLPEVAIVFGVSDSDKLTKAFVGYRKLVNDILDTARNFGAPIPEEGWPPPKTEKVGPGTMYYWPIPQHGQDEQVQPNLAVSPKFLTISLSAKHTERLLGDNTIASDMKRLGGANQLWAAGQIDFAGILAVAKPWIDAFAVPAIVADIPDQAPPGLGKADVPPQVNTIFEVLSTLKRISAVTYRDGNTTVTHYEQVIEDVK